MAPILLRIKKHSTAPIPKEASLSTQEETSKTWRICTKIKDNLEHGPRLENLSWRLWHMHRRIIAHQQQPMGERLSSVVRQMGVDGPETSDSIDLSKYRPQPLPAARVSASTSGAIDIGRDDGQRAILLEDFFGSHVPATAILGDLEHGPRLEVPFLDFTADWTLEIPSSQQPKHQQGIDMEEIMLAQAHQNQECGIINDLNRSTYKSGSPTLDSPPPPAEKPVPMFNNHNQKSVKRQKSTSTTRSLQNQTQQQAMPYQPMPTMQFQPPMLHQQQQPYLPIMHVPMPSTFAMPQQQAPSQALQQQSKAPGKRSKNSFIASNPKGQSCPNCHTTQTPLWRKIPTGETVCNACGLYYKMHDKHRPITLKRRQFPLSTLPNTVDMPNTPAPFAGQCSSNQLHINMGAVACCFNCSTTQTPLWRRDDERGVMLCNACGLYKKLHSKDRPLEKALKKRKRTTSSRSEETQKQSQQPVQQGQKPPIQVVKQVSTVVAHPVPQ